MLPDRVSNPGPLTYESGALPIALRGPAWERGVGWLFWVERSFETVFQSISDCLPKRGRKRRERTDESKNVQTSSSF